MHSQLNVPLNVGKSQSTLELVIGGQHGHGRDFSLSAHFNEKALQFHQEFYPNTPKIQSPKKPVDRIQSSGGLNDGGKHLLQFNYWFRAHNEESNFI